MGRLAAGVRRRKNGLLEKRFTVNGKRYSIYGHSMKEINKKEQDRRVSIALLTLSNKTSQNGSFDQDHLEHVSSFSNKLRSDRQEITLSQYYHHWRRQKSISVRSNTIRCYDSYYKPCIEPYIGSCSLSSIDRRCLLDLQRQLSKRMKPSSVNMALRVLKIILNDAARDGILQSNSIPKVQALRQAEKATKTYHRALGEWEQEAFMTAAKSSFYYPVFAMQLLTGMRIGEIGALKWSDIDFSKGFIHVQRTVTRTEKGIAYLGDLPKSEAGIRDIPLNHQIKHILQIQREQDKKDLVFSSPHGKLIESRNVNREIKRILQRLHNSGIIIAKFTSHAFRDTFATRYIEQGGSPQVLKELLGHASITMTMDLYSQVMQDTKKKEMEKIKIWLLNDDNNMNYVDSIPLL